MKGVLQRLDFLTRGLSGGQRKVLGAIAVEGSMGIVTLVRVLSSLLPGEVADRPAGGTERTARGLPASLPPWVHGWLDAGLLVHAGAERIPSGPGMGTREGAVAVHEEFEQLVLRQAAISGDLTEIVRVTRGLLGDKSRGPFVLLLQTGQLVDFQRHAFAVPGRAHREGAVSPADQMLRESICRPFEAHWFEGTWREAAVPAAHSVLREALSEPFECDGLFGWVSARVERMQGAGPTSEQEGEVAVLAGCSAAVLHQVLCEHAMMRGLPDRIESLIAYGAMPAAKRLAFEAVASFLLGESTVAFDKMQQYSLADDALGTGGRRTAARVAPDCGAALPLLALLWLSRNEPKATAEAKRLLSSRGTDSTPSGVSRALRTLLRTIEQPDAESARIDVHQLPRDTSVWEVLVLGLTVQVSQQPEVTRASWAKYLVTAGALWIERGYRWIGRQALFLARSLHLEYFDKQFEEVREQLFLDSLHPNPGELLLSEFIAPRPQWRRALDSLAAIAEQTDDGAAGARRVAWYVDMVHGTIERPVLQELRGNGWTAGRRLSVARLREISDDLPPEDTAVLSCARVGPSDRWEFAPEALEALIGHPRVFNGVREQRVEVVRQECQVRTEDDAGFLRICVEPEGAKLGVNVVVKGESRLSVVRVSPEMQQVIEALPHGLRVPLEHQAEALAVLGKLSHGVEVVSPQLGEERVVDADSTPCFRISPVAGAWMVQAGVRPFGEQGRFFIAGTGRANMASYVRGAKLRCSRDFRLERARVSLAIADCPVLLEQTVGNLQVRASWEERQAWDFDEEGLLELMVQLRDSQYPSELEWPEGNAWKLRGSVSSRGLSGNLRRKKGWYIATGTVALDDETVLSLRDLVAAPVIGKGRFVRLPSGDVVEVERRVRQVMDSLAAVVPSKAKGKDLQIHAGALGVLQSLGAEGFSLDEDSSQWLERVEQLRSAELSVPAGLSAELRSYQLEGFRWLSWLSELGLGACLADDMGLGKTVQIIAFLLSRQGRGPVLVVAPTSVCANWVSEVARFAPQLVVQEYLGPERSGKLAGLPRLPADDESKVPGGEAASSEAASSPSGAAADITVCSYGLLQQDGEELASIAWDTVVLDEAQFIKNPDALRARAACALTATCRIAATGTPVENHLGDLWSIFQFLNPGLLGTWRGFNQRFVKPVERDGNESARQTLKELVRPFLLRRTKGEVLKDLPALTTVRHEVRLSEAETMRYTLLRRDIHEKLHTAHGKRHNKLEILAEITRLRRFCCDPSLVFPDAGQDSSKINAFLQLVEELRENNHRALVFSQFVDFLDLVRQQLDERGVSYQYLDGSTSRAQRKIRVDQFQGGEGTLFLISLKAGGFGLNLTAADYVIHLDPWWNPAVESQATDRAHRIGQLNPVTVYRLVTKDTIEESIVALHEAKKALADSLLEEGGQAAKLDVSELLSLIEGAPSAVG